MKEKKVFFQKKFKNVKKKFAKNVKMKIKKMKNEKFCQIQIVFLHELIVTRNRFGGLI